MGARHVQKPHVPGDGEGARRVLRGGGGGGHAVGDGRALGLEGLRKGLPSKKYLLCTEYTATFKMRYHGALTPEREPAYARRNHEFLYLTLYPR